MKHLLFLLLPALLSAQSKSEQVHEYLGQRYEQPAPKGTVHFHFQVGNDEMFLTRNSDGIKTYETLLKDVTGYQDSGGKILGVSVKDEMRLKIIKPETKTVTASTEPDPVRPRTWSIGDSATNAARANEAIQKIDEVANTISKNAAPWWKVGNHAFSKLIIGILFAAGFLWLIASTSAGESRLTFHGTAIYGEWLIPIHQWSSFALLVICWFTAFIILINLYVWIVELGCPLIITGLIWAAGLWLSRKTINGIVPNIPIQPGSYHSEQRLLRKGGDL